MNAPLTEAQKATFAALPDAWTERIFMRLHGRFGNAFYDKFRIGQVVNGEDVGVLNAKSVWGEELAELTPDEIKRGLQAKYSFPPSCDEFKAACRPDLDDETLFHQACACALRRKYGEPENWPSNRLFWAYQRIGGDLLGDRTRELRKRFAVAYAEAAADENKPIPQASQAAALPAPGKTTISQAEAKKRTDTLKQAAQIGKSTQFTSWAYAIANDPADVPTISIERAIKAFIAWGVEIPQKLVDYIETKGLQKLMPEAQ